jgi:hypothetical protein
VGLTVAPGNTYIAQLKEAFTEKPLGAPLTITTKRADINLHVGCPLQCITSVGVEPHGTWAQFPVKTSEKALITVEASTTPPNADGTWSNPDDVAAVFGTILPVQEATLPLQDLAANTTYHYVVHAHDGSGHQQFKTGSFKTLTRRVEVTFAEIQMIDDSDDLSDCDCFFWFQAGNSADTSWGDFHDPKSIASGTSVHPNVTVTATNAPSEIPIRANGNDKDDDPFHVCSGGSGPKGYEGWGDADNCLEWAGRWVNVPVARPGAGSLSGVDEQFTESFTILVGGEGLKFRVNGTYKVTYVP